MQYIAVLEDESGLRINQYVGMHAGESSAISEARLIALQMDLRLVRVFQE